MESFSFNDLGPASCSGLLLKELEVSSPVCFQRTLVFIKQTPGEESHFPGKLLLASTFRIKVSAFASPRLHIPMMLPPKQTLMVPLDVCFPLCYEVLDRTVLYVSSSQDKVNCW